MNYIPMGAYTMGPNDQNAPYAGVAQFPKGIGGRLFYIESNGKFATNKYRPVSVE